MGLLQTASFRGVPFKVVAAQVHKGRRWAVHEYPYIDGGWPEDMGRSLRTYSFSGYLIGDLAPVMQNLLDLAIEKEGPGLLIHPTIGAVRVGLLSASSAVHRDKMRVIEVAFQFVEAGDSLFPLAIIATAVSVLAAAQTALTSSNVSYGAVAAPAAAVGPAVTGEGASVVGAFAARTTAGGANPTAIVGMATALPPPDSGTSYGRFGGGSASALLPAGTTVAGLQGQLAKQRAALALAAGAAVSTALSYSAGTDMLAALAALVEAMRAGIGDPASQVRVLLGLARFGYADGAGGTVGVGAAMAVMRDATAAACRRAALISLARASAAYQPTSYDDAADLRESVAAALDAEITAAGDSGEDAAYGALKALRSAVVRDLTVRGANLPSVAAVKLPVPLTALTVAQMLYTDAARSDEIVARSGAVHPAFIPVMFKALTSGLSPRINAAVPAVTSESVGTVLIAPAPVGGIYHLPPPGGPSGLNVLSVTATTVSLSWSPPPVGGLPSSYVVQVSPHGASAWSNAGMVAGSSTSFAAAGLTGGTEYDFQIIAHNATGDSAPSSLVSGTTAVYPPNAPAGLVVSAGSPSYSAVALSWTASAVDGTHAAAATYQVRYQPGSGGSWTNFGSPITGTSASVTGLAHAAAYNFQVVAANASGTAASASVSQTTSAQAPNAATGLAAAAGSPAYSVVALSWTASAVDSTHDAPSTYQPQFKLASGGSWANFGSPVTGTSVSVTGLTHGTAYNFQVIASNSGGSAASGTVSATTSTAVPNAVTGLAGGTVTATTVPLTWTASAVDGSHDAAATYTVQYRINGSAVWTTASGGVSGAAYTVTGLIAGLTYQFNVFAVNAGGTSAGATATKAPGPAGGTFTYWGTGGYPTASVAHGSTTTIVAFISNGGGIASAQFGWSATQVDPPAVLQAMTTFNSGLFGSFSANTPAAAGSYHGWMIFSDSGGNRLLAVIASAGQTQQSGTAIADPVTVA